MTICKNCCHSSGFKDPVNDKWIALEADRNLEYESPELTWMKYALKEYFSFSYKE